MQTFSDLKKIALITTFAMTGLTACGGSDSNDSDGSNVETNTTLEGTAAVGAAINGGLVEVIDANGNSFDTSTDANGNYSIQVSSAAPYALSVTYGNGEVLYSYASGAGTANITPLTSFTLYSLVDEQSLQTCYANWSSCVDGETIEQIEADLASGIATINANLETLYGSNGVDTSYNYFTETFTADGSNIDAVLDALNITVDYSISFSNADATYDIDVNGENFAFNAQINTDSIVVDFNGTGPNGNQVGNGDWTLLVTGTYSVNGMNIDIPDVTVNNIEAPNLTLVEQAVQNSYQSVGEVDITVQTDTDSHKVFVVTFSGSFDQVGAVTYNLTYDYTLN